MCQEQEEHISPEILICQQFSLFKNVLGLSLTSSCRPAGIIPLRILRTLNFELQQINYNKMCPIMTIRERDRQREGEREEVWKEVLMLAVTHQIGREMMFVVCGDVLSLISALCLHGLSKEHGVGVETWSLSGASDLFVESHIASRCQRRSNANCSRVDPLCWHLANANVTFMFVFTV